MTNEELKALRLELGLTQYEMGKKLGVTAGAISRLEAGKNKMSRPVQLLAVHLQTQSGNKQ